MCRMNLRDTLLGILSRYYSIHFMYFLLCFCCCSLVSYNPILRLLCFVLQNLPSSYFTFHYWLLNTILYSMLLLLQSMLAVDISETNSRLSLAIADQRITDGEIALNSKASVVRLYLHAAPNHITVYLMCQWVFQR